MAKLGRSTMIRFLVLGVLFLAATSWAQQRPPVVEQIAKAFSSFLTFGSGSPRPARFPSRERIRMVSQSKLPTCARSSTANPTP
jgi:hypothetical protein